MALCKLCQKIGGATTDTIGAVECTSCYSGYLFTL